MPTSNLTPSPSLALSFSEGRHPSLSCFCFICLSERSYKLVLHSFSLSSLLCLSLTLRPSLCIRTIIIPSHPPAPFFSPLPFFFFLILSSFPAHFILISVTFSVWRTFLCIGTAHLAKSDSLWYRVETVYICCKCWEHADCIPKSPENEYYITLTEVKSNKLLYHVITDQHNGLLLHLYAHLRLFFPNY